MRAGWCTDLHLDFFAADGRRDFYRTLRAANLDALLAGGDIGEADSVADILAEMDDALGIPIWFVLGNHDYYKGSIAAVRAAILQLTAARPNLRWLTPGGFVPLGSKTALAGHDGWADGRLGDYSASDVLLNDYFLIEELRFLEKDERFRRLNALGDEAARALSGQVREALRTRPNLLVLTHVPPFREACWHEGRVSDDLYLPHFACGAAGDALAGIMSAHPEASMTVLCGHTHSAGFARILDNLVVLTGAAEYGRPELQRVFQIPE
jgi:3',5'-cyclic-AMP phosphodiesterase